MKFYNYDTNHDLSNLHIDSDLIKIITALMAAKNPLIVNNKDFNKVRSEFKRSHMVEFSNIDELIKYLKSTTQNQLVSKYDMNNTLDNDYINYNHDIPTCPHHSNNDIHEFDKLNNEYIDKTISNQYIKKAFKKLSKHIDDNLADINENIQCAQEKIIAEMEVRLENKIHEEINRLENTINARFDYLINQIHSINIVNDEKSIIIKDTSSESCKDSNEKESTIKKGKGKKTKTQNNE